MGGELKLTDRVINVIEILYIVIIQTSNKTVSSIYIK